MSTETKHSSERWEYWRDHSAFCPSHDGYDYDCDCEGDFIVGYNAKRRTPESDPWTWNTICDGVREEGSAKLIVEAGNAYHETGLTPWQLAEQRRELLEALEAINNAFRVDRTAFTEEQEQAVTLMDAALEKATGEKLEPLSEDEIAAV